MLCQNWQHKDIAKHPVFMILFAYIGNGLFTKIQLAWPFFQAKGGNHHESAKYSFTGGGTLLQQETVIIFDSCFYLLSLLYFFIFCCLFCVSATDDVAC